MLLKEEGCATCESHTMIHGHLRCTHEVVIGLVSEGMGEPLANMKSRRCEDAIRYCQAVYLERIT